MPKAKNAPDELFRTKNAKPRSPAKMTSRATARTRNAPDELFRTKNARPHGDDDVEGHGQTRKRRTSCSGPRTPRPGSPARMTSKATG